MMNFNRGTSFAQKTAATIATANLREAVAFAVAHWGATATATLELKSAVAGGSADDNDSALTVGESDAEFLDIVRGRWLLGRMQNLRRVPISLPVNFLSTGSTAYWVGESKGIPLSRTAFTRLTMSPKKLASITVFSNDLAVSGSGQAIATIRDDLEEAGVRSGDLALIDPSNAGSATTPASITHGAPTISSTGDLADDVEAALAAFEGSLLTASWIASPRLAAQAGLRSGDRGAAADLGARGGVLAGLPLLTSESVPAGTLVLVDAAGIVVVEDGIRVERSTNAMVEQDTAPTGATDTPTAATATRVSLFQTDSVAARMIFRINWARARDGSVVVIDNAAYRAAS